MILNQTLLPESRCLQITDHYQHCHQTVSCREDYRNKKVPLYQVGPAYHAPGVISHFQELHVDVETNGYEGYTPADAKIALEMTKQPINNPTSKSKNANDLKGRKSIFFEYVFLFQKATFLLETLKHNPGGFCYHILFYITWLQCSAQ